MQPKIVDPDHEVGDEKPSDEKTVTFLEDVKTDDVHAATGAVVTLPTAIAQAFVDDGKAEDYTPPEGSKSDKEIETEVAEKAAQDPLPEADPPTEAS